MGSERSASHAERRSVLEQVTFIVLDLQSGGGHSDKNDFFIPLTCVDAVLLIHKS